MGQIAPIRVGVIGTGVMGGHHTRVAATLPGCQLLGIHDLDTTRAAQVADQFGVTAYATLPALCDAVDAVIVASPTSTHARVAGACLQAGCHVLVEKPIDSDVAAAEELLETWKRTDRVLMIGHLERFNPAVTVLRALLAREDVFAMEFQRLSPTPPRDRSADIIFDLMIHDLDLVSALNHAPVTSLHAMGHHVRYGFIDHVTALLRFANGATATLTASCVSQQRVREGRIFTRTAQFTADLARREVWLHRHGPSTLIDEKGHSYQTSQMEQIGVPQNDPLAAEQEHFLQAIRSGVPPLTTPESGLQVLRLAQTIQDEVNTQLAALV